MLAGEFVKHRAQNGTDRLLKLLVRVAAGESKQNSIQQICPGERVGFISSESSSQYNDANEVKPPHTDVVRSQRHCRTEHRGIATSVPQQLERVTILSVS